VPPTEPQAYPGFVSIKALGASKSTTFVLPLELSSLVQGVAG
jgi:hypothetical protein